MAPRCNPDYVLRAYFWGYPMQCQAEGRSQSVSQAGHDFCSARASPATQVPLPCHSSRRLLLHPDGRAYGPVDPRQGQADFVSTKNRCGYAALTRITRPKTFHHRDGEDILSSETQAGDWQPATAGVWFPLRCVARPSRISPSPRWWNVWVGRMAVKSAAKSGTRDFVAVRSDS